MNRFLQLFLTILFAAGIPSPTLLARLNVVATTADLASLAETVGGENVSVTSLARGTEDPHFVSPRPSFIRILNRADVLIEGGAELESGWLPPLVQNARNRKILPGQSGRLAASRNIDLLGKPSGPIDRSMGDVHASGNPHFLLDPVNAQIVARDIAAKFAEIDPKNAAAYRQNSDRFHEEIDERLKDWETRLAPFRGEKVVTYHKNYDYFARRFGFEIIDAIEPLPGIEPPPRHIVGLISRIRENGVRMIWVEPFRPRHTAERIARETGAKLVVLPVMVEGIREAETYIDLIDYNVSRIAAKMEHEE